MSRWALGTRGAGVTSTARPMMDASIRLTPLIDAPRSTMEYSISLSVMAHSSATEVNGPMYELATRVPKAHRLVLGDHSKVQISS